MKQYPDSRAGGAWLVSFWDATPLRVFTTPGQHPREVAAEFGEVADIVYLWHPLCERPGECGRECPKPFGKCAPAERL